MNICAREQRTTEEDDQQWRASQWIANWEFPRKYSFNKMKLQNFNSLKNFWDLKWMSCWTSLDLYHRIMMEWFRNCILFNYVQNLWLQLFHLQKLFMVNLIIIGLLSTFSPRHSFFHSHFSVSHEGPIESIHPSQFHHLLLLVLSHVALFDGSSEGNDLWVQQCIFPSQVMDTDVVAENHKSICVNVQKWHLMDSLVVRLLGSCSRHVSLS